MVRLVVFDWDGTLMDSVSGIVRAMQAAALQAKLPVPDDDVIKSIIGLGLRDALYQLFPFDMDESQVNIFLAAYRDFIHREEMEELGLFDGVTEVLETLRDQGFQMAVATGKGREGLERAFSVTGIKHFFASSRCVSEAHSKPHPQMLQQLMSELDQHPEQTLMIGDSVHDLQMAASAGVAGLAVSYGCQSESVLRTAPHRACLSDIAELPSWLQSFVAE